MARPKIRITLVERRGPKGCHRGHRPGDSFDFDTERGARGSTDPAAIFSTGGTARC